MNARQPRHINLDAVMLWRSLSDIGPARIDDLVQHWAPTFSYQDVSEMLQRLQACGCVVRRSAGWTTTDAAPLAVPGIASQQAAGARA